MVLLLLPVLILLLVLTLVLPLLPVLLLTLVLLLLPVLVMILLLVLTMVLLLLPVLLLVLLLTPRILATEGAGEGWVRYGGESRLVLPTPLLGPLLLLGPVTPLLGFCGERMSSMSNIFFGSWSIFGLSCKVGAKSIASLPGFLIRDFDFEYMIVGEKDCKGGEFSFSIAVLGIWDLMNVPLGGLYSVGVSFVEDFNGGLACRASSALWPLLTGVIGSLDFDELHT